MDTSTDVSTMLANASVTFKNQANIARKNSADALRELDDPMVRDADPFFSGRIRQRSAGHLAEAAVWDARSRVAAEGNLLFTSAEHADTSFIRDFADLIRQCRAAGRLLYERPLDAALDAAAGEGNN